VVLGEHGTGVHPPLEGSSVLLQGCCTPAVREWAAQSLRGDPGLTAQCRTVAGMASPGELAEQRRDMIPRRVRGTTCVDSSAGVRALSTPVGGAGTGATSPWEPRATNPRARWTSPEGASSPRARRNFTSGGAQPSSDPNKFHHFRTSFGFYIIYKHFSYKLFVMLRKQDARNFMWLPRYSLKIHQI
jgi:hypothetical protein